MSNTAANSDEVQTGRRGQRLLRRFFHLIWVEVLIGALVIASVGLTLQEMMFEARGLLDWSKLLGDINLVITLIFVAELSLRFWAAASKRAFFSEYWLDILAVLPVFRVFRTMRALRLLRLFRVLRLIGVANRLASHFPYVLRRGILEYIVVCGLLLITVVFGTAAMMYFENVAARSADVPSEFTFENSFWFSVYSLFAGEPTPITPLSVGGKLVTVFVMFMGLTIFAMFTGTVSAFMVERFRMENKEMEIGDLENHIVICGWNNKAEIIIREFRAFKRTKSRPVVVITELDAEARAAPDDIRRDLYFVHDDFTRVAALERAEIKSAQKCIILSDVSGGRSEQDADARTILAALTVEKISPRVYTCAELINRSYASHLDLGHVNDYVVSGEYSAYMLAQASMHRGLMGVLGELLTYQHGQHFVRQAVPESWHGKTYDDMLIELKRKHHATLVAVQPQDGQISINPTEHVFAAGDEIVIISGEQTDI